MRLQHRQYHLSTSSLMGNLLQVFLLVSLTGFCLGWAPHRLTTKQMGAKKPTLEPRSVQRGAVTIATMTTPATTTSTTTTTTFMVPTNDMDSYTSKDFSEQKENLVTLCTKSSSKPSLTEVQSYVQRLEQTAEDRGIGQCSSTTGLLNGEWELLYSPEDKTRSSPFFWAFQRAFPENANQIFSITDAIPSPIKDIGPAMQTIEMDSNNVGGSSSNIGTLVSRVKVATLNGMATSMMTTRTKIIRILGVDTIELQIETTKPEESTIVKTLLGPILAPVVGESLPAFPSGEALERVVAGSSRVTMKTTFCDETLRISRNVDNPDGIFIWARKSFGTPQSFERL